MGDRLGIRVSLPAELAGLEVPPMLLQPLVENAIRHGLEPKVEGGTIELRARRKDGRLVVEVADTGIGFRDATSGGVGLANIRERLRLAHGDRARLTIRENAPQGTIVSRGTPGRRAMSAAAPKVLIADDEPALAEFLRARLAALWPGAVLLPIARNGLEALASIRENEPDAAFLDIRMPGLTGLELAARIDTPTHVVFVTAYDQYAVEAFDRDAVDYVVKPVSDERLSPRRRPPESEDLRQRDAPGDRRSAGPHRRRPFREPRPATCAGSGR